MTDEEWIRITEGPLAPYTTFYHFGERVFVLYLDETTTEHVSPATGRRERRRMFNAYVREGLPERNDLAGGWSEVIWWEQRATAAAALACVSERIPRYAILNSFNARFNTGPGDPPGDPFREAGRDPARHRTPAATAVRAGSTELTLDDNAPVTMVRTIEWNDMRERNNALTNQVLNLTTDLDNERATNRDLRERLAMVRTELRNAEQARQELARRLATAEDELRDQIARFSRPATVARPLDQPTPTAVPTYRRQSAARRRSNEILEERIIEEQRQRTAERAEATLRQEERQRDQRDYRAALGLGLGAVERSPEVQGEMVLRAENTRNFLDAHAARHYIDPSTGEVTAYDQRFPLTATAEEASIGRAARRRESNRLRQWRSTQEGLRGTVLEETTPPETVAISIDPRPGYPWTYWLNVASGRRYHTRQLAQEDALGRAEREPVAAGV
jgi:hypothetical protein